MKLRDLFKLEIGDELRLKGTDLIFEIVEFDENDAYRPLKARLVSGTPRGLVYNFLGGEPIFADPVNRGFWVFNTKTEMVDGDIEALARFDRETRGCEVVTICNLEVLTEGEDPDFDNEDSTSGENLQNIGTGSFAVGDIVTIPGMNATFEIVEYDDSDPGRPYRIKILETDRPVRYEPHGMNFRIGNCVWIDSLEPKSGMIDDGFYMPASDHFVRVGDVAETQVSQEPQGDLPNACKIREIAMSKRADKAIKMKLEEITGAITRAANDGKLGCDVEGLTPAIIERLKGAGYTVNGNRINW